MEQPKSSNLHIAMLPWFAVGHVTPYLYLSNRFAEKGHTVTLMLPQKLLQQHQHLNLHPTSIHFHNLTVPAVDGLPAGTQTASDIPIHLTPLLSIAFDRTIDQVQSLLSATKPDLVLYDFAHWLQNLTTPLNIKPICFNIVSASILAHSMVPARGFDNNDPDRFVGPPRGYPSKSVMLRRTESHCSRVLSLPFGEGVTFFERITGTLKGCDAIAVRTCRELEGQFCDYLASQYNKPVLLTGPLLPEPEKNGPLDEKWANWLDGFEIGSVVYCAFGSQHVLEKEQFQELLLGFELSGFPFLVAVKPPKGTSTVEEAYPNGFEERMRGRGLVWGGWVPQREILEHPSVGCLVNHGGSGSLWESLLSDCQIVFVPPNRGDFILQTRLLADELKVAVEVEKDDENGWVCKENLCKAIKTAMDPESEVGNLIKKNHAKWKQTLASPGLMSDYIDRFLQDVERIVKE